MPTALSQTRVYIYFIYKLNLHGCHHIIAFSLEKTSSSFQVKREGQQVAPGPNRAAVTDQHDGALHWGISQPCPTANPSLCDMIHKDPHAIHARAPYSLIHPSSCFAHSDRQSHVLGFKFRGTRRHSEGVQHLPTCPAGTCRSSLVSDFR